MQSITSSQTNAETSLNILSKEQGPLMDFEKATEIFNQFNFKTNKYKNPIGCFNEHGIGVFVQVMTPLKEKNCQSQFVFLYCCRDEKELKLLNCKALRLLDGISAIAESEIPKVTFRYHTPLAPINYGKYFLNGTEAKELQLANQKI